MFTHSKLSNHSNKQPVELKSLSQSDSINIEEKLNQLSVMIPSECNRRFQNAFSNYMRHRSSVINIRGTLFGYGCMMENLGARPYVYYLAERIDANKSYPPTIELALLLNEAGMGKDKKSLNFHVLVEMFDLKYQNYDDKTANKFIEETLVILHAKFPQIKPQTGPRMAVTY